MTAPSAAADASAATLDRSAARLGRADRPRGDRLEARLSDTGEPFDDDLRAAALPDDDLSEGGRGLALAEAVLDEFTYTRTSDRNVWQMVRRRQ